MILGIFFHGRQQYLPSFNTAHGSQFLSISLMWLTQLYFIRKHTRKFEKQRWNWCEIFNGFFVCVNFGLGRRLLGKFSKDIDRMAEKKKKHSARQSSRVRLMLKHFTFRGDVRFFAFDVVIVIAIEMAKFQIRLKRIITHRMEIFGTSNTTSGKIILINGDRAVLTAIHSISYTYLFNLFMFRRFFVFASDYHYCDEKRRERRQKTNQLSATKPTQ